MTQEQSTPEAVAMTGKRHGKTGTREYRSWVSMRRRCNNPADKDYGHYGGRGITICERWDNYLAFLSDMGPRPDRTSLDRIDNDGNYEPGNCRWANQSTQLRNQRPRPRPTQCRRGHPFDTANLCIDADGHFKCRKCAAIWAARKRAAAIGTRVP